MTSQFVHNVIRSFQHVRNDVTNINIKLAELEYQLQQCQEAIKQLHRENQALKNKDSKRYIASETGRKAYPEGSLHAKNIKNRIIFDNRQQAIDAGYRVD